MSWHDRINAELAGSYRGVPFHVEQSTTIGGRRWLLHEYPRRDRPYSEDMGRKARNWQLTLFVAGEDYDRKRDALIEALDAPGAATLVHPYLGRFAAVASEVSWVESSRDGGVCTFTVTFAEAGEQAYPVTTVDSQREVEKSADQAQEQSTHDFGKNWNMDGLSGWSLADLEADLNDMLNGIDDVINGIADDIAAQFRAPGNMAGSMMGAFNRFGDAVMRPGNALDMYSGKPWPSADADTGGRIQMAIGTPTRAVRLLRQMVARADSIQLPEPTTPELQQRVVCTVAAQQLHGRAATITAARLVADSDWMSSNEALAASQDVLGMVDDRLGASTTVSDSVYAALVALRTAVVTDMRQRNVALPSLASYTPQRTLSALLVAHRLYGDARHADEVVLRNNSRHPGFLRGGVPLEVINE